MRIPLPRRSPRTRPGPHPDAGRRVLITGAASGLGLEFTRIWAGRGAEVIATDVHDAAPAELAAVAGDVRYRRLDVTDPADWAAARADLGGLDILVSNAGIAAGGRIEVTSLAEWRRILDINLMGAVHGCREFTPVLADGGRIVLTASAAGLVHAPLMSAYNVTKAAVVALGETLAIELAPRDITVTAVCPFFFRSNLSDSLAEEDPIATAMAQKMLHGTHLTSAAVAHRAMRGIDAGRVVALTDGYGGAGWYLRRLARWAYLPLMRAATRRRRARLLARGGR